MTHRRLVFLAWAVIFILGGVAAGPLGQRLSFDFSLPGQEGYQTQTRLTASYGTSAYASYVPVLTTRDGGLVADRRADVAAVAAALRRIHGLRVLDYADTGDRRFIAGDGSSTFMLVYAPQGNGFADPIVNRLQSTVQQAAATHGLDGRMTGYNLLQSGNQANTGPSILVETLLGGLGALIVLLFVFGSLLAFVPLLVAAVSILATFLVVLALTTVSDVSFVVEFLISLVGLGVAIDYSLLVVSRWREERARGADNEQAVVRSVLTAGRAVMASGLTVAISLLALVVVPVPLIRSMGLGGMLIPIVSTLVVLTLLPALLGAIGPRLDWPRIRNERSVSRAWSAWARGVVRYRWIALIVGVLVLGAAIVPVFGIQIGQSNSSSMASNGAAHDALTILERNGVGSGVLTTMDVLVSPGHNPAAFAQAVEQVNDVRMAVVSAPGRGGLVDVTVVPDHETVDSASVKEVDRVRDAVKNLPGFDGVAGLGPTVRDYGNAVYQKFGYVLAAISVLTFLLLARTFRSVLLPLKAVVLNLLSVSAAFGLATWFWQDGHGSQALFGISPTGAMTFWIPVLVFAFLFGLSMDYEVFILSRIREEYEATGSTSEAVEHGLGRTGRLVTSAALILFFAFAALASAPGTDIKVFATTLGVGILLDATVVRALLVPALVSLFGSWNWWLPEWAARALRVKTLAEPQTVVARQPVSENI